jgi:hypothetical protein
MRQKPLHPMIDHNIPLPVVLSYFAIFLLTMTSSAFILSQMTRIDFILTLIISFFYLLIGCFYDQNPVINLKSMMPHVKIWFTWPAIMISNFKKEYAFLAVADREVFVNGIFVGELSNKEYRKIRAAAFKDSENYLQQIINTVSIGFNLLCNFMIGMPLFAFWCVILIACEQPKIYQELLVLAQDPANIKAFTDQYLIHFLQAWLVVSIAISIFKGNINGFVNEFNESSAKSIRQYFNVIADGKMSVLPIKN